MRKVYIYAEIYAEMSVYNHFSENKNYSSGIRNLNSTEIWSMFQNQNG